MKIKSICSIQGTADENEDALGSFGNFFWVIDGATDLYHAKKSIGYSVSEVTHLLSKVIVKHCSESKTLKEIFSERTEKAGRIGSASRTGDCEIGGTSETGGTGGT